MRSYSSSSNSSSGVGFCGLLTCLFIGLKLTGFIDWPWVWVLSPIWGSLLLVLLFFTLFVLVGLYFDR